VTGASLRLRLLVGAALWIGLALIAVGFLLVHLFRSHLEASAEADLQATLNRLVAQINRADIGELDRPLADPRYELPYGGFYWQISDLSGQAIGRSPSLFDFTLDPEPDVPPTLSALDGPAGARVLGLSRTIRFTDSPEDSLIVTVARDRGQIDLSVRTFSMQLASALALVWGALTLAALLQVHLGLAPLANLRRGIEDVRAGRAAQLRDDSPRELSPLVSQVNGLLEAQRASLEFARARAGDLAHALRTPLAALQATETRLRDLGDHREADALGRLAQSMSERIEYQLRLTQLRLRSASVATSARLRPAIEQIVAVLERGGRGGVIRWTIECPMDAVVQVDRHDLMELIGVLLENAMRHTDDAIEIVASREQGSLRLVIADNGPGMTEAQIVTARQRGVRHDQSHGGTGLGLSIALDIAEINGGSLELARAPSGGLCVSVILPGAISGD
jgi:signal transduction histidine kinase